MATKPSWEAQHFYSELFEDQSFVATLLSYRLEQGILTNRSRMRSTSSLNALCDHPLLSQDGERMLFLKMNYAKYRASITPNEGKTKDEYQKWLDLTYVVRNQLVTHNLRLLVRTATQHSIKFGTLDDLIGDGSLILLNAVDKFDSERTNSHTNRRNRFSTYATASIVKTLWRRRKGSLGLIAAEDDALETIVSPESPEQAEASDSYKRVLDALNHLSDRERTIVLERANGRTLKELGITLGITKERVRQTEGKAFYKIKKLLGIATTDRDMCFVIKSKKATRAYLIKRKNASIPFGG